MENKLLGKTIVWNGDSICAGNKMKGNWATRIGEKNSMLYKNYAVGGGTITENTPKGKTGQERHSVSATLEKMHDEYPDVDYIIFEGGTNDADLFKRIINEGGPDRLGSFDPSYFGDDYDRDTFCGALESLFKRAVEYWPGKKIGYIIAHKMGPTIEEYNIRHPYFLIAAQICQKWGIPYLDLWHCCYLNPFISTMYDGSLTASENNERNVCYYCDGQHLTSRGYDFTAEIIENWLKNL